MHPLCYLETKPGTPHHKRIANIGPGSSVSQDVQRVFLSVLLQSLLLQALPRPRHLHKGPRNHPIVHKHTTHAVSIAADHALAGYSHQLTRHTHQEQWMLMLPNTLKAVHDGSKAHLLPNVQGVLHRIQGKNAGQPKRGASTAASRESGWWPRKTAPFFDVRTYVPVPAARRSATNRTRGPTASSPPRRALTRKTSRWVLMSATERAFVALHPVS
ncbi:polyribonucleotide 5'-hydroxyl-kinase [Trypanosoma cruzi]|nr:polyribonucleotide 5'-hydroxyl-kinase [Trypanosoma cruzi]